MQRLASVVIGTVSILLLSWVATRWGANAVTAGFIYLVAVLLLATWRGFLAGAAGSLAATFCFNYFFLNPIGTLHIDEQENWVALICLLIASVVVSQLVLRAQNRAADADARRNEVLMLYELCVDLFAASGGMGSLDGAVRRALGSLGARSGGFIIEREDGDSSETTWFGSPADREMHRLLSMDGSAVPERQKSGWRNVTIPVTIGSDTHGTLVVYGTRADPAAVESVAKLVGLAVERETLIHERAEVEALQASDDFKTALLRAVSHDLSTPLTAMTLQVGTLRRTLQPEHAHNVDLLDEEMHRLRRRIENLLAMARLESGNLGVRREPTPPADLFRAAREHLHLLCATRPITAEVAGDCPDLDVDPSLAAEILVNLIENAHRASAGSAPIELQASLADGGQVRIDVLDRGSGLGAGPPSETSDTPRYGLGLQIARAFARANGGSLSLKSRIGGGARASVFLPAVADRVEAKDGIQ